MLKRSLVLVGASALATSFLGAPIAADVIAYRTEDGVFAYTDDHEKVPARYAADAVTVRDANLHGYPRLTLEDTAAAREVSARLQKRLDYLRQANAASSAERAVAANASAQNTVVSIPTSPGLANSPSIEVSATPGDGPVVVEQIRSRDGNRAATRGTTLVKQGDKVIAVMKSRAHHIDVTSDFHDEAELEGR